MQIVTGRAVAPEPAHHLRHRRPAELLTVQVDAPSVGQIVAFVLQGGLHANVLVEPVTFRKSSFEIQNSSFEIQNPLF